MNIESVTIPTSITEIGLNAFWGCSKLKTINYHGTQAQWEQITKIGSCIPNVTTIQCTDGSTVFKN